MRRPHAVRTIGRTAVVACWLVVLTIAGEPTVLTLLVGAALVLVWASPYLLVANRRDRMADGAVPPSRVVAPRTTGPAT
jgi:hypothetical protein